MSDAPPSPAIRIVPGAPPPVQPPKNQKKKRKAAKAKADSPGQEELAIPNTATAALIEKASTESDVKEGSVAPSLVIQPEEAQTPIEDPANKPSPIIELVNKRLKTIQKKINRIEVYSSEAPEKLNDDQLRLLKTLPGLEATRKELEEVKKAIAVHEAEVAQENAVKEAEVAKAERQRIADAVAESEATHQQKTIHLLHFLRLRELVSTDHPAVSHLGLNETEMPAIHSITETILSEEHDGKVDIVRGFTSEEGEIHGVSYSRLLEITEAFLNPPETVPSTDETAADTEQEDPTKLSVEIPVVGIPSTSVSTSSFHFMQEDELEGQADGSQEVEQSAEVEVVEAHVETEMNGHAIVEESVTVTTTTEIPESAAADGAINWADEDEGGLPSIGSLHAQFGSSEQAVPGVNGSVPVTPSTNDAHPNGRAQNEDGFMPMSARGRGRGGHRGGFRGDRERGGYRGRGGEHRRGEHRGGDREHREYRRGEHRSGEFRGGEHRRGEHRGGEFRGGEHRGGEHRGGYRGRGGDRGGYLSRSDGDWRGGDGEHRGRGRGRGLGRDSYEHRGGPPTPAPAPPA